MAPIWQHPHVNIFKSFNVSSWKKSTKEGEVTTVMDKSVKCTVYRINGSIPASNYLQLPKTSTQCLALTGRYMYLLFQPHPGKYFVVHLDVATKDNLIIRVSFSNLFKEFKSTHTWLQFPFVCSPARNEAVSRAGDAKKVHSPGPAPFGSKWAILCIDFEDMLSLYLNKKFMYLKNIQLCANMSVKNVFTSDVLYHPGITKEGAMKRDVTGLVISPLPREMAFPLVKGDTWHDHYDYIRFPYESPTLAFESMLEEENLKKSSILSKHGGAKCAADSVPVFNTLSTQKSGCRGDSSDRHVYAHIDHEESVHMNACTGHYKSTTKSSHSHNLATELSCKDITSLQPDPILKLERVIGYGGATYRHVLWTQDGQTILYPCHAVIIAMNIANLKQRFYLGHTDKVSCISLSGDSSLLASGQAGQLCIVRVWNYASGECLVVCKAHDHSLFCLSFSQSGSVLCGVGKDALNNSMIVIWNTSRAVRSREATVIAKAHTKTEIVCMKVSPFDDSRMVSCGRDNIRVWRVKEGTLRSAAVNLGYYSAMEFTDICCDSEPVRETQSTIYACSKSGHIFEVDPSKVTVKCVRRLLPSSKPHTQPSNNCTPEQSEGISINAVCVRQTFCATASDDGYLRLWPLDFSSVYLEAEHDGPVMAVDITADGLKILAATSTGTVGMLEMTSRNYTTLMRSHTDQIHAVAVDPNHKHMTTVSSDHTIRIWNMATLQQLFDFSSPKECPLSVAYHPHQPVFACGFEGGIIRVFNISTTTMMAEFKQHPGDVICVLYSPNTNRLFSACTQGTLCMYTITDDTYTMARSLSNCMVHGEKGGMECVAISPDGQQLAFVGPIDFLVTIMDANSLDEIMRIDISGRDQSSLDHAVKVHYTPHHIRHLLVTTSSHKLIQLSAITGSIMDQVESVHRGECTSLVMTSSGKNLATAGDRVIKVWDYSMAYDINFQVFIGHSEPIKKLAFSPDSSTLVSVADAVFLWHFVSIPHLSSPRSPKQTEASQPISPRLHFSPSSRPNRLSDSLNSNPRPSPPQPQSPDQRSKVADISSILQPSDAENLHSDDDINPNIQIVHVSTVEPHEKYTEVPSVEIQEKVQMEMNERVVVERENHVPRDRPSVHRHFIQTPKLHGIAQRRYVAAPNQAGLKLESVVGYNGNARANMVWHPDTGLFIYTCGCMIVIEDLETGHQQHLSGHTEEISTIALQQDCQYLATASGAHDLSHSQICIWKLRDHVCAMVLTHHEHDVICLAYSRDARFLISIGDYRDLSVVVWSTHNYHIITTTAVNHPIHAVCWDPYSVNEFATVGDNGTLLFWLLDETGDDIQLQVHQAELPDSIFAHHRTDKDVHLTGLQYTGDSTLYVSGSNGKVSVWDTRRNACFMYWDADSSEIGVLVCRERRLLTGSVSCNVRMWSVLGEGEMHAHTYHTVHDAQLTMEDEMTLDGAIVSASFDEQLEMGIVGTGMGTLWYINWTERTSIRLVSGHSSMVNSISVSSTNHFASCCDDGRVRIWTLASRDQLMQFQVRNHACKCVTFAACSSQPHHTAPKIPDVAAGYSDGTVRMFDVIKGEMVLKMHPHASPVTAITFSSLGRMILSGATDGQIAVSSRTTGMTVRLLTDHRGASINNIDITFPPVHDIHPLNTPLVWLATSADRRVSVWSADWAKDFCEIIDWLTFPAPAFCPDGTVLPKGDELYKNLPPSKAVFSREDNDIIVYVGYGMQKHISFYSLAHKKVVRVCNLTHWCSSMDLSPSGLLIVMGNHERLLKVMDLGEGSFQDFVGHNDSVHLAQFSHDGQYLLTAAYNEIFVWKVLV